jgi:hypothetical protein
MKHRDRFKLLHGPYLPPKVRRGRKLFCEIRGTVTVGGYSNGPIPWPRMKKGGNPCLVLCGDLVRAVRVESNQAVAHHWGLSTHTVSNWHMALGVPEANEGTRRLGRDWALGRTDGRLERARERSLSPASVEKRAAQRRGRPPHPNMLAAARRAQRHTPAWRAKVRAYWLKRGHPPGHPEHRHWTPREDALLGTAPDAQVARRLRRSLNAVYVRRCKLGVPAYLVRIDGRKLLRRG